VFNRRKFRDCVGCPCFLKSCIAVVDVNVKVYDVCCRSCEIVRGVGLGLGGRVANATRYFHSRLIVKKRGFICVF